MFPSSFLYREAAAPVPFLIDHSFTNDRLGSVVIFHEGKALIVATFAHMMIADHIQANALSFVAQNRLSLLSILLHNSRTDEILKKQAKDFEGLYFYVTGIDHQKNIIYWYIILILDDQKIQFGHSDKLRGKNESSNPCFYLR